MSSGPGRNDQCPCDSGRKYKKCCLETRRSSAPIEPPPGWLTLEVHTKSGVLVRYIPPASPLRTDLRQGTAAEEAVHDVASIWGLPDFVHRAEVRKLGSGSRELGDGLIVVGKTAVAIQVKSREALSTDDAKERRWIDKVTDKGLKQGAGTIRQLKLQPAETRTRRDRVLSLDGNELDWLICVVIDHPDPPSGVVPSLGDTDQPAVVLLRRDWDFLFSHLKSMTAVVNYLRRVADKPTTLGTESGRFYEHATSDEAAPPDDIDPALLGPDGHATSSPLLPLLPTGDDDIEGHRMLRIVLEDIATSPIGTDREADRHIILGEIDRLPVAYRAAWGRMLIDVLDEFSALPQEEEWWRFRRLNGYIGGGQLLQLGFGVCSAPMTPRHQDKLGNWVRWRHHQLQERVGERDLKTVCVLLTPRRDGKRGWSWDTTMSATKGVYALEPDEIADAQDWWESHRQDLAPAR